MKREERHEAREKGQRDERGGMSGAQNRMEEEEERIACFSTFTKHYLKLLIAAAYCLMW